MNFLNQFFSKKIVFLIFLFPFFSNGQTTDANAQSEIKYPQFKVQGLFQGRYLSGFTQGCRCHNRTAALRW